jgi:hypothetical protein
MKVWNKRDSGIPASAVYVGRPTKWGNPFAIGVVSRAEVVQKYEQHLMSNPELVEDARSELKGKDLVCWCAPQACHADVLMRVANS